MTNDAKMPASLYLTNGRLVTAQGIVDQGHLLIEAGQISSVGSDPIAVEDAVQRIDVDGAWVVPGLIDLHTHGLLGNDNMGPGLAGAIQAYPSVGVTSFLATTISAPAAQITEALSMMAEVLKNPPAGAQCLGIHLEGPYLSLDQAGMANPDWFIPFSLDQLLAWQQAAGGGLRLITLAPECLETMEVVEELTRRGLILSAGHTNASYEQLMVAFEAGVSQATHTFNAMSRLHHRQPGAVGAILAADQVKAEVIADGHHVHPAVIALLVKAKGIENVLLVSDSAPMAGLPAGKYSWQEQTIFVREGRCQLDDGTLAGGYHGLDAGLRTIIHQTDLTIEQAIHMAATSPARALGLTDRGQLKPSMRGDVVLLDPAYRPAMTIINGQLIWRRPGYLTSK